MTFRKYYGSGSYEECAECNLLAFDPPPCHICFETDRSHVMCETCRRKCDECGEHMCEAHTVRDEAGVRCRRCQTENEVTAMKLAELPTDFVARYEASERDALQQETRALVDSRSTIEEIHA